MTTRTSSCNRGQLGLTYDGPDPERISLCHVEAVVLLNRVVVDDRGQSRPVLDAARRSRVDQCARDRHEPVRCGILALAPRVDLDVPSAGLTASGTSLATMMPRPRS